MRSGMFPWRCTYLAPRRVLRASSRAARSTRSRRPMRIAGISPLYHLIDERLGDAKVLGGFRNVQKPIIPDGRICSLPPSISRRHRLGTAKVHVFIIAFDVKTCVQYLSHLACHFVYFLHHAAPHRSRSSWRRSASLAFQRRFLHDSGMLITRGRCLRNATQDAKPP